MSAVPAHRRQTLAARRARAHHPFGVKSPPALDLAQHRRVDEHVAERRDRGHVGASEQAVALHEDRHLAAVAAGRRPRPSRGAARRASCGWRSPARASSRSGRAGRRGARRAAPRPRSPAGPPAAGRAASARARRAPPPGSSQPSSAPSFQRTANSARAIARAPRGSSDAIVCTSRGKSRGRPASAAPTRPRGGSRASARGSARAGRCARRSGASSEIHQSASCSWAHESRGVGGSARCGARRREA